MKILRSLLATCAGLPFAASLTGCIVADNAVPLVDLRADALTQYNHRGMPQNEKGVLQGEMAVNLPDRGEGSYDLRAWGNVDLDNDTGDAWFPDGHGGELTEVDVVGSWSRPLGSFDLTVGLFNYAVLNGAEFVAGPALGQRGPTSEVFVTVGREVLGLYPSITAHYDYDEVEDLYVEAAVQKSLALGQKLDLDLLVNLGWSGEDASLWAYGLRQSGLADLRGSLGLRYALSDRTTLRAMVAASTMLDSEIQDWFDVIGVESDNVWGGLGVTWSF